MAISRPLAPARSLPARGTAAVGEAVYVVDAGGELTVATCDPHDMAKMPALGVVVSKPAADRCLVHVLGEENTLFSGLVPGRPLFVGVGGQLQQAPVIPPCGHQMVGMALTTTSAWLIFEPMNMVRRI